nr:TnsD family Tn7-like transposition protein [Paenibacillus qinlingensis]
MEGHCKHGHVIDNDAEPFSDHLQEDIHEDLEFLFKYNDQMSLGIVRQKFLEHLFKGGYVSTDGKTRRQLLAQNFLENYSSDELASVGLSADYIAQRNTLERVFWGDSLVINLPILFLLIRFIAGSLESFISTSVPYATEIPFGLGPWPCANKYCPDYNKMVIQKCSRVDNRYRGVTGKFYCATCGNEYVRDWNRKKGIKENIRAVITSETKKNEIVALYRNGGLSMETIACQLYCSVYSVKQAVKSDLLLGIEEHACAAEQISPKRDAFRIKVESTINKNPGLNRYEICLKCKTAYEWLKRNDTVWLEKRLPVSKSFDRFDWNEVDELLSQRVSEVARGLIENNPGTRVGIYSIIGALNKTESGRIKNYSQHLPITQKVLEQVVETKEQYQLRHLAALVWQLKSHYGYEEVTLDTILSYRRSYRAISKDMRDAITAKLVEIQNV